MSRRGTGSERDIAPLLQGDVRRNNRELNAKLEVLHPMRERPAIPRFEPRLMRRGVSAARQPGAVKPIERAKLRLDGALDLNLGDEARRKQIDAHFIVGGNGAGYFDGHIVPTLFERHDLRIFPLISEPLPVGEAANLRPGKQSFHRVNNVVAFIRAMDTDVGDASRREIA